MDEPVRWVTRAEAAEEPEIPLSTLDRMIRRGEVKIRREGRRVYVRIHGPEYLSDEELLRRAVVMEDELERTVRDLERSASELQRGASELERERAEAREAASASRQAYREMEEAYQKETAEHKEMYSFSTLVTLGLLSLSLPSGEELGGGEIAEGLVRPDGVVSALPGHELAVQGGDLQGEGGDLMELLRVGALGALDAPIQLGRARGQDEEVDAACLAGLLEGGLELGASVHLDGPDGEGHAGHEPVEEARGCRGRGAGVGFQHVPAGDDVAGGEVFEHDAGDGAHVQGVHLDQVAGLVHGIPLRLADRLGAPPAGHRGPSSGRVCAPPSRWRRSSPRGGAPRPACPCPTGGTAPGRGAPRGRALVPRWAGVAGGAAARVLPSWRAGPGRNGVSSGRRSAG